MPQAIAVGGYTSTPAGDRTYIAQLDGTADFAAQSFMPRGDDRKTAVVNELARLNQASLEATAPALDALKAQGLISSYEVNPLSNTVTYTVAKDKTAAAWKAVNAVEGIGRITRDREVFLIDAADAKEGQQIVMTLPTAAEQVEWNVARVKAPEVWAQGHKGAGIVVGIVDTGVDVNHPALKHAYRGTMADGSMNHNYSFFDAVAGKKEAYDDNKHGTHVGGTVHGLTPEGYATGVAPESKFIASKILSSSGSGTLQGVLKGLEWMLAPTDSNGQNADPTMAPDIISNSWGSSNGKDTTFKKLLQSFLAAGIEPVFAAGNSGPRAGSLGSPGSYPEVISVGSTDKDNKVSSVSSRGPSP
ncbi:MAG: serine protease, partial [Thermoleophilia bacterium]|nr:serine protease [Thermoleophilia bacterium]